jgi:archaellum component FlaC
LVRAEVAALSQDIDTLNERIQAVRDRLPPDFTEKFERVSADAKRNLATLENSIAKVQDLAERVAGGQGTVGALMNDPEFSDDAKKLGRFLKRHPWKIIKRPRN